MPIPLLKENDIEASVVPQVKAKEVMVQVEDPLLVRNVEDLKANE